MSKVARSLALIALVIVVLVVGSPPAQASYHGQVCRSWFQGGGEARACVVVNTNDSGPGVEGLSRFIRMDQPSVGYFIVEIDYIRLVMNGNVVDAKEDNVSFLLGSSWQERTTGFLCHNPPLFATFHARVRYQFTLVQQLGSPKSGWLILNSQNWYGRPC
jgi:hypothetical protein